MADRASLIAAEADARLAYDRYGDKHHPFRTQKEADRYNELQRKWTEARDALHRSDDN